MTPAEDAAGIVVSHPENMSTDQMSAGHAVVMWMAQHFNRPATAASLKARIPAGDDLTSIHGLARAMSAIGLKSQLVERAPSKVDPVALPAIVFGKNGDTVIFAAVSEDGKAARLITPTARDLVEEVPLRKLKQLMEPKVLLVTPAEDQASGRLSPDTLRQTETNAHWFWGAVRANWGSWLQVLLAAFLANVLTLALPLFVMNVYDKVIPNLAFVTLWTLAIGVGLALLLDLVVRTIRANILENVSRRVDIKVASKLFDQAMHARLLTRPGGPAGIASTIRDFETVREFFASATFIALIDLAFIGIFIAVLYMIVGPLAIVPLVAVPVVLILSLAAQIPIGRSAAQAQRMATKRQVVLVESLSSIETIKSLNAEPVMQREWENAVAASSQINGRSKFWSNVATNGAQAVQQAVSIGIIVWGVFLVSDGLITIGGLIAANILAGRVLAPLGTLAQTIFRAQYAFKSLAALNRFMDLPVDQPEVINANLKVSAGAIKLEGVGLTYPQAQTAALTDLNLDVHAGECVALLGKVGSGKTTVGKVMCGLLKPDSGLVQIDGVESLQYDPADLREGLGYLPQTPELFTGTLRENLLVGAHAADDQALMQALYHAAMDEFVADTPEGLDLFIGEQGNRLSGGQKQGIALARLLLRRPKMLFLDEPTNAMDQRMETQVVARLGELSAAGTGLILCTHRQSLTAMANRLIVMDRGRVVLDGPNAEVIAKLKTLSARAGG
jgi:ATP-binding cassette subfamily C protein LapB